MTSITINRAVVEQALHVAMAAGYPVALIAALRAALEQQDERDWSLLEATQESLREHMAEIHRLRTALAQQAEPVDADAAYQRWLGQTHAPALRRMDSQGAFAAGWQAAIAAVEETK